MVIGTKRKYALHMKDGTPTIEGLLVKRCRDHFVLINAEICRDRDSTEELGGRVEVLRENVYCLQEIK